MKFCAAENLYEPHTTWGKSPGKSRKITPKDVHLLICKPINMFSYMDKGSLQPWLRILKHIVLINVFMYLKKSGGDLEEGDYPGLFGESNVIIRILVRGRQQVQSQRRCGRKLG